jgi:hypothetical protein
MTSCCPSNDVEQRKKKDKMLMLMMMMTRPRSNANAPARKNVRHDNKKPAECKVVTVQLLWHVQASHYNVQELRGP